MNIKEHLDKQTYDKYYQDIECINHIGYAQSWKTWDNIKDLVDWTNKYVLDIGCFHGYFSFKALERGATKVDGIDKNFEALQTAELIRKEIRTPHVFFINETANEAVKSDIHYDIALVLNIFHHIPDKDSFLKDLKADKIIFEIDKEDLPKIEEYCKILVNKESHRPSAYTGDIPNKTSLLGISPV